MTSEGLCGLMLFVTKTSSTSEAPYEFYSLKPIYQQMCELSTASDHTYRPEHCTGGGAFDLPPRGCKRTCTSRRTPDPPGFGTSGCGRSASREGSPDQARRSPGSQPERPRLSQELPEC